MMLSKKSFIALALLASLQAPSIVHAGKIRDAARAARDGAVRLGHSAIARSKDFGKAVGHGVAWPFRKTCAGCKAGYHKAGALASRVATGIAYQYRSALAGINHACETFHSTFQPPATTEEIRTTIQELNRQSRTMISFIRQLDTIAAQPIALAAGTTADQHVGNQLHGNQPLLLFFNLILTTMRNTPALAEQLTATANNVPAFTTLVKQQAQNYGFTTLDALDEASANLHLGGLVNREILARTLPWLKKLAVGGIIIITALGIAYLVFTAAGLPALAGIALIPLQLIIDILGSLPALSWSLAVGAWHLIAGNSALQAQAMATFNSSMAAFNSCIATSLARLPTVAPTTGSTFIMATPALLGNIAMDCFRPLL